MARPDLKIDVEDEFGRTPLHSAAKKYPRMCELLLEKGANPNVIDRKKYHNPIETAVRKGAADCIPILLKGGCSLVNPKNPYGGSPLHLAFLFGHWNCVKKLVELGIDTGLRNNFQFTGFEVCVVLDQFEVLQKVMELKSLDPNLSLNEQNR